MADLVCPECGEPVRQAPPAAWIEAWGPRPGHSHHDGQPLCPVMSSDGYRPAQPIRAEDRRR